MDISFNIANYLRINLQDIVMVLVSTALIILFAKHFFWDKIIGFVKARQTYIQENIDASETIKKEAMDLKNQYDEKMKHAGQDAHVIIETARNSANEQKKQILTQAEKEATRIKEKAQEDIDRDRLKVQDDMKNAIGDVAIEAAKKLVDKDMDETTQRKFVDDFINQVGDSQW